MRFFKSSSKPILHGQADEHDSVLSVSSVSQALFLTQSDGETARCVPSPTASSRSCVSEKPEEPSTVDASKKALASLVHAVRCMAKSRATESEEAVPAAPPSLQLLSERVGGRKRALLIGINYTDTPHALRGCHRDVDAMRAVLLTTFGFPADAIQVLTDAPEVPPERRPTRAQILIELHRLVEGACAGDTLFLHFSGHGHQLHDTSGDEVDGLDEAILPCDYAETGPIVDDTLYDTLVRGLPAGVRLTVVFDSCHSGTALDLPYLYLHTPVPPASVHTPRHAAGLSSATARVHTMMRAMRPWFASPLADFRETLKLDTPPPTPPAGETDAAVGSRKGANVFQNVLRYLQIKQKLKRNRKTLTSQADVVMFAACCDYQSSADAIIQGEPTGAMSWALIKAWNNPDVVTYADVLAYTRMLLAKKYKQTPQLSSGKRIDLHAPFEL